MRSLLDAQGLGVWALGAHLVGQAVCDPIDGRHRGILPPDIYGDGDPEGVRQRAAGRMADTARAAAAIGVEQVNGFTGSAVWHLFYSFPPNDFAVVERGYQDFAERWGPILDVFERRMRFGLEVHPTEIAYDFVTTRKTLDAIDHRPAFGINLDPSHFAHQFLDAAAFALEFADRIYHVHVKDAVRRLDGRRSILASHLNFGDESRGWDSSRPDTGTSTSRRSSERSTGSATQVHSPSNGRTQAWTASTARGTPSPTFAAPTFRRPSSPSTRRCSGERTEDRREDQLWSVGDTQPSLAMVSAVGGTRSHHHFLLARSRAHARADRYPPRPASRSMVLAVPGGWPFAVGLGPGARGSCRATEVFGPRTGEA